MGSGSEPSVICYVTDCSVFSILQSDISEFLCGELNVTQSNLDPGVLRLFCQQVVAWSDSGEQFRCLRFSPGAQPLIKKPEDSGIEIEFYHVSFAALLRLKSTHLPFLFRLSK